MSIHAHTFNVELAAEVGLNQAILLQHLYYWHQINENKKHNIIDDKVWTYNTAEGFSKIFPYLTAKQISYAFSKLEESDFITIGNHNKAGFDQTKWYSLNEKALKLFVKSNLQNVKSSRQNVKSNRQNVNAIPDNNPDNNTDNKPNTVIDVPSDDDIKGKMFFKLVDMYPKNRVGNRQHGLKKFKTLDTNQGKLTLINLNRYLKVAGPYVKNLQNYITEECWSEDWLRAEETKLEKQSKTDINTKTFKAQYGNI